MATATPARAKPRAAAKNRRRAPAEAPQSEAPAKLAKAAKPPEAAEGKVKQRLVRDSFTIPKQEYAVLATLKQRAVRLEHPVKKSELLRAGIAALQAMPDAALLAALKAVPALKPGRPKNSGKR